MYRAIKSFTTHSEVANDIGGRRGTMHETAAGESAVARSSLLAANAPVRQLRILKTNSPHSNTRRTSNFHTILIRSW